MPARAARMPSATPKSGPQSAAGPHILAVPAERDARALALLLDLSVPLDAAAPVEAVAQQAGDGQAARPGRRASFSATLLAVLAVQTVLSIRLVRSNSAFPDEALYLSAGHAEIGYWLHGGVGHSAVLHLLVRLARHLPAIGALADSIGGLAGARILSLCLMLGVTTLLYLVTRRIFDRTSALFAIGLFAGTSATQFLGAFATYDAMALFLLALATWLGIRAIRSSAAPRLALLAAAGSALAVADAAKYAAALFDLVVIAVVALATWQRRGRRVGCAAAAVMLGTLAVLLAAGLPRPYRPAGRGSGPRPCCGVPAITRSPTCCWSAPSGPGWSRCWP